MFEYPPTLLGRQQFAVLTGEFARPFRIAAARCGAEAEFAQAEFHETPSLQRLARSLHQFAFPCALTIYTSAVIQALVERTRLQLWVGPHSEAARCILETTGAPLRETAEPRQTAPRIAAGDTSGADRD